ncbi:MAG: hypothetical protein ACI4U6_06395 [Acutalibacteraceae bacterium]
MSKKLLNKLLSAVLVLAICSASLFGCVITVNAEGTYNGTYTVSVGDESHHVALMSKYINARVTFNLDAGMGYGYFSIAKSNGQGGEYAAVSVEPVSATLLGGGSLDAQQLNANKENYFTEIDNPDTDNLKGIIFDPGSDQYFTSLTFDMTFEVGSSWYVERNKQYSVTINVADNDIAAKWDNAETHFDLSATENGTYHVHMANWQQIPDEVATAADDHYTMVDATCSVCGQTVKQVYANPYEDGDTLTPKSGPWGHLLANGITVNYDNDGSLSINVHGRFLYGSEHYVMVCDAAGNKIIDSKSGATKYSGSVALSQSALAGTALHADNDDYIKTYTIGGLSARDIDTDLYITLAVKFNTEIQFSNTIKFSLKDYALSVIDGNGVVYPESATEAEKTADKNVAAALCYYGEVANNESIFKNEEATNSTILGNTTVTPVEKSIVKWQDTSNYGGGHGFADWDSFIASMTGEGSEASPYIITTAEQLFYLASVGSTYDNTTGKYFKVDENIGAFDFMNNAGATPDTTAAEVQSGNTSWNKYYQEAGVFAGNFDGSGVIVYNYFHQGNKAGLFPTLGKNAVVKNVSVAASAFVASSGQYARGAGGIFGQVVGSWGGESITIENCKVVNCYISAVDYESGSTFGAGAIGGYAHALVVNINNCFVADNIITATSNGTTGGLIATGYSASSTVSNTVVLGATPYNTWVAGSNLEDCAYNNFADATTFSNVYTDQPKDNCYRDKENANLRSFTDEEIKVILPSEAKGANSVANLNLDSNLWAATEDFPVFKIAYTNWTAVSNGASGHTYKSAISLAGTVTTITGDTEEHNMQLNEEGTLSLCTVCGYGKKVFNSEETTVTPVEKSIVKWQDTSNYGGGHGFADWDSFIASMTGEGSEASPYIITTAEQLFYLASVGSTYDNTTGKYFKVDENIGAFDFMNNAGATPDTTAAEVQSGNTSWNKYYQEAGVFAGNFDGSGVIVYNYFHQGNKAGLFPTLGKNAVVKNVSVAASAFVASSGQYARGAGGIFGQVVGSWGGESITIENCKVVNCYISAVDYESGSTFGAGAIGGYAHALVVNINNCFVADNIITATSNGTTGGLIATGYSASSTVSNTVVLGATPYNTWVAGSNLEDCAYNNFADATTFSNVYTDQPIDNCYRDKENANLRSFTDEEIKVVTAEQITGAAAITNTNLNFDSTWFAVADGYPDLREFHDLVLASIDGATHHLVCATSLDGTPCTVCGVAEAHDFSGSDQCICGKMNETVDILRFLPESVKNVLLSETVYTTKFANNALFKAAYQADNTVTNGTIEDCCFFATSLNLKTTPYISFTFAFNGEYRTNKANITATFTVDGTVLATVTGDQMINNAGAGRYHLYRLKSIPTTSMCKQIDVVVKYEDTTMVEGSYSVAGYAINAINAGTAYNYHAEAAKSLVYYSEMVAARYGA